MSSLFNFLVTWVIIANRASCAIKNVTLQLSSVQLPIVLFRHISAVYDNTLHIIGGFISNTAPNPATYSIPLPLSDSNDSNIATFERHLPILPDVWPNSITCRCNSYACDNQCYVTVNESLYFVQTAYNMTESYLIAYNMTNHSYSLVSTYRDPNSYGWNQEIACLVTDGHWIWWLPSSFMWHYHESYNIDADNWSMIDWSSLSSTRRGVGCVYYQRYMYLFGGIQFGSKGEAQYLEKCELKSITNGVEHIETAPECNIIPGSMRYDRSFFEVQKSITAYGAHAIIYGGTPSDFEAIQSLEIFDFSKEQMTTTQYAMNGLDVSDYSSVVWNDTLFIVGGIGINDTAQAVIKHTDIAEMFKTDRTTFDYDCVTREIDAYLYTNAQQLVFKVYTNDTSAYAFQVRLTFYDQSFYVSVYKNIERNAFLFTKDRSWGGGWSGDRAPDGVMDIDIISEQTNIDMSRSTAMWMKWSAVYDETGSAISSPIFRMGFGDIADQFRLADFAVNPDDYAISVTEIIRMSLIPGSRSEVRWEFYHDQCSIQMALESNDAFKVGDMLQLAWYLSLATSLNIPIYIQSDDIVNMNYVLYIEGDNVCTLCKLDDDKACSACSNPVNISIDNLYSYDVANNNYAVHISSQDSLQLQVVDNNPIKLTRIVTDVEISIEAKYGIYPHSVLHITPFYDTNNVSQPNATITIIFDDDLSFVTTAQMLIHFYTNECVLILNNYTNADCSYPIIVPPSMKFKPIASNDYSISIESDDVNLIQQTSFTFPRVVQTVSIEFNDTLSLGDAFSFKVHVLHTQKYQDTSSLIISNYIYDIAAIIHVDHDTNQCFVVTPITGSKELCDKGVEIKVSNKSAVGHYIDLKVESEDTYVDKYNNTVSIIRVLIEDCPIGQGLIGTTTSSYSCTDCVLDHVGISSNSQCIPCYEIPGVECLGKADLIIAYNYWIAVDNEEHNYALPIFTDHSSLIISNFCPSGYCCQSIEKGCNYLQDTDLLCAAHRDPNIPLCGGCVAGYSEVFGSAACKQCPQNNYSVLIASFAIAFLIVLFLYLMDHPPRTSAKSSSNITDTNEVNYLSLIAKDDLRSLNSCFLRPMLYFFQGISFISLQTGFWFYLSPLMNVLSLDLLSIHAQKDDSGVCFMRGLTATAKQLWHLYVPFSMFLSIAILAFIHRITKSKLLRVTWQDCWNIFIIFIGNMITIILKLLACTQIGNIYVHFYAGYHRCFESVWFFAVILFIFVIFCWIWVWYKLYRMDPTQRNSRQSSLRTITKHYKPEFWYWEIVLVSRRIVLALMVTIEYISYDLTQYILLAVLIIYLCLHFRYYPFLYTRANNMESVCMFMLIFCFATIIFNFDDKYPQAVSIIMSLIVSSPIVLFIAYLCLVLKHCFKIGRNGRKRTWVHNKIRNIQKRVTTSQRNVIQLSDYDEEDEEEQVDVEPAEDHDNNNNETNTDGNTIEVETEMITLQPAELQ